MADAPKILPTDYLDEAYPKINQAIDNANEAFNTSNEALSNTDLLQTQMRTIVNNYENIPIAQNLISNRYITSNSSSNARGLPIGLAFSHSETTYFVYIDFDIELTDNMQPILVQSAMQAVGGPVTVGSEVNGRTISTIGKYNVISYGKIPYSSPIDKTRPVVYITNAGTSARTFNVTINKIVVIDLKGNLYDRDVLGEYVDYYGEVPYLPIPNIADFYIEDIVKKTPLHSGQISDLNTEVQTIVEENFEIPKSSRPIVCPGDSLTAGTGGNGTNYPGVLATLSGRNVINLGSGGDTTKSILGRFGALPLIVQPFTINADISASEITIKSADGGEVNVLTGGSSGVNPVIIHGVEGTLNLTDGKYLFRRSVPGDAVQVTRPEAISTKAMREYRDCILCIFMGQNGGYSDIDNLINQHKYAIDYIDSLKKDYVIIGLTTGSSTSRAEYESKMLSVFGRRFINAREYLSKYGIEDSGLTPTTEDLAYMEEGKVPPSLLSDEIHLNEFGYIILGNLVYKRLKEFSII